MYNQSGAERDTQQVSGEPYLFKSHPAHTEIDESTNYLEWSASQQESALPLPTCYGFLQTRIAGVLVDVLLVERIAFTGQAPSPEFHRS